MFDLWVGAETIDSAAQQWREISNRLDDRARLEAELLGNLSSAALNPESVQPGRCSAVDIPGVCRDEPKLWVCDLHPLGSEIVDARADFEDLDFLNANDLVEKIANTGTLCSRLQHFWLAIRKDREFHPCLLQRLKTGLHIRESGEAQVGVHQLLLFIGCQVKVEIFGRPDQPVLSQTPEIAVATHEAPHETVL